MFVKKDSTQQYGQTHPSNMKTLVSCKDEVGNLDLCSAYLQIDATEEDPVTCEMVSNIPASTALSVVNMGHSQLWTAARNILVDIYSQCNLKETLLSSPLILNYVQKGHPWQEGVPNFSLPIAERGMEWPHSFVQLVR